MRYTSAAAFRMALEDRIGRFNKGEFATLQRVRKGVAFERLVKRLQASPESPWFLKGAFALDLRFGRRARVTKDLDLGMDLSLLGQVSLHRREVAGLLRTATTISLDDFFTYDLLNEGEDLIQEPDVRAYRFLVRAGLAGRPFEDFRVDVGVGTQLVFPLDEIPESDTLAFAGIVPGTFRTISLPQHFAEKIHAFTRRWEERENTRVKDLVDIALILEVSPPEPSAVLTALRGVFGGRGTHQLPAVIPDPPSSWAAQYAETAVEIGISCREVGQAMELFRGYWPKVFP